MNIDRGPRGMIIIIAFCIQLCMVSVAPIEARSGNGGAIAAGIFGGALLGGAVAAASSQRNCSPDDPACFYDPYMNRPYLYAGPVVYAPGPYAWGPGPGYVYVR